MPARKFYANKLCLQCGVSFNRKRLAGGRLESSEDYESRKYCGMKCRDEHRVGENHHNWRGGVRRGHNWGYLRVTDGRYVHRIEMEKKLGRPLDRHEHVHHIDGNVTNNAHSNLELVSNSEHRVIHNKDAARDSFGRYACRES